jgi:hypothetical protein
VVEGARLESEYTSKAYRGFESLRLRQYPYRSCPCPCGGVDLLPIDLIDRLDALINQNNVAGLLYGAAMQQTIDTEEF